jgi:hypothetical protein
MLNHGLGLPIILQRVFARRLYAGVRHRSIVCANTLAHHPNTIEERAPNVQVCYVTQYSGSFRGVLVTFGQEQVGHFPLGLFDEAMAAPAPEL